MFMENNLLFDGIAILICLWFIKSYFLGKTSTREEKFLYAEAPRWLLLFTSSLVILSLLAMVAADRGFASIHLEDTFRFTVVSFLLWLSMALYTKWNWGVHMTDPTLRRKNNRQMLLLLLLMMFLASGL